jgi:hypothetical protein
MYIWNVPVSNLDDMRVIILLVQSDEQIPHTYATTLQQLVTQINPHGLGLSKFHYCKSPLLQSNDIILFGICVHIARNEIV